MPAEIRGDLPRHPNNIEPAWLTGRLRDRGILTEGQITSVRVEMGEKWNAAYTARLLLDCHPPKSTGAPESLFVKIRDSEDPYADSFPGEFAFFKEQLEAQAQSEALPLPRCLGLFKDETSPLTCLLLEDYGASHEQPPWPLPASLPQCEAAVVALAKLHGHWWTTDLAETFLAGVDLARRRDDLAQQFERLLENFLAFVGDRLAPERRDIMRAVCARLPALLWQRLTSGLPLTRIHGDPHSWNILFPKDPSRHGCIFIDWEDWQIQPGPFDLAYMVAYHWFPERRARYEEPLLRLYHRALCDEISEPYRWQQLRDDYRLGALHNFVVPWFVLDMGIAPEGWWYHLEQLFASFEDLGCAEFL
ncbi:MAG: aminoglycoside phosphotransferase family protein [Pseudomonadota bacterium]